MNNQQPIKRHKALVSYSKDHHFGLQLVWKIRQGLAHTINAERIGSYVLYFFKEDLARHFAEEETVLFPLLPASDLLRIRAEAEHATIYNLLHTIEKKSGDTSVLIQFADTLEAHIRFEERELFQHLQASPAVSLDNLPESALHNSRVIDDAWQDCFWK